MTDQLPEHPPGDYAIVEVMGHRTIVGRISEVERFGTKLLAIEAIWQSELLPAALIGGASIYQLTPCTAATAFERQPKHHWQLPPTIVAIAPQPALPAPEPDAEEMTDAEADAAFASNFLGVDQGGDDREFF
jgi:hypothetical protein